MIPGLEFNRNGLCPMCASATETAAFKSVLPLKYEFPQSKKSRFDVAVFYTGGKDTLIWEIPFISPSARKSIENAKKD